MNAEETPRPTRGTPATAPDRRVVLESVKERLEELQAQRHEYRRLCRAAAALERELEESRRRLTDFGEVRRREKRDVTRLEGLSLTRLLHSVLGDKETRLDRERQELLSAVLKHERLAETVAAEERELRELEALRLPLLDVEARYEAMLQEKANILGEGDDDRSRSLARLSVEKGELAAQHKELKEAIREGSGLLAGLDAILESLGKAEGWGVLDLVGGGLMATVAKHSSLDEARERITAVQTKLNRFRRELSDVDVEQDLKVGIGSFDTFADYFFDGLIADWAVQSTISRSKARVADTREQVHRCVTSLRRRLADNEKRRPALQAAWRAIVESA